MPVTAIHPGEHLAEEIEALNMSAAELARQLKVPTNRITGILNGAARHYRRHRATPWSLLRHERSILAESAESLRIAYGRKESVEIDQGSTDFKEAGADSRVSLHREDLSL